MSVVFYPFVNKIDWLIDWQEIIDSCWEMFHCLLTKQAIAFPKHNSKFLEMFNVANNVLPFADNVMK